MNEVSNFSAIAYALDGNLVSAVQRGNCTAISLVSPGAYLLTYGVGASVAPPPPLINSGGGHRSEMEISGLPPAPASFEPGAW
jgi:hypothetical protein